MLTVTQMLRKKGVVGKFVEFYGPGLANLSLEDMATIANMAPEYGATCGFFPVDAETLAYLEGTARAAVADRAGRGLCQGAGHVSWTPTRRTRLHRHACRSISATVEPSIAGPKRPQDRVPLSQAGTGFAKVLADEFEQGRQGREARCPVEGANFDLGHGDVVIAAITSCTNTSNPSVMMAAGLARANAVKKGLSVKPWVKTSLAPGSQVVTEYLDKAGLQKDLDKLGFDLVGYGCTTCIGNSGPLPEAISEAIHKNDLVVAAVLSGNRNFEGRVNPDVRANYLASPPLVVAYALAGALVDFANDPIGHDRKARRSICRTSGRRRRRSPAGAQACDAQGLRQRYKDVFKGDAEWRKIKVEGRPHLRVEHGLDLCAEPALFRRHDADARAGQRYRMRAILGLFLDSITTDHISPAGNIRSDSPAGNYLVEHQVAPRDFNSYGARRGNHEVMMRGTFANIRIKNQMVPGVEGGVTIHYPSGEMMPIYDAAMKYSRRRSAGHLRRQGIWHRLVARLGGQGHAAARRARRHRPVLRAHPPLEPHRHGRAAARLRRRHSWQALGLKGDETVSLNGLAESSRGNGSRRTSPTRTARRAPCPCAPPSILSTSSTISAMAAFCITCCARWRGLFAG